MRPGAGKFRGDVGDALGNGESVTQGHHGRMLRFGLLSVAAGVCILPSSARSPGSGVAVVRMVGVDNQAARAGYTSPPPGRVPSGVAGDGVGEDCWLVAWARWEAKGA